MAETTSQPLLIKRYASRRLYNTETSDYVTLEDIAGFIRAGREVQIVDLKTGDDLTRQYLLQIIAEHESRGENVLPLGVLTDLVRTYSSELQSVVPQFLEASFEMLRQGQEKMMENMGKAPMAGFTGGGFPAPFPGLEALQAQQAMFLKALGSMGWPGAAALAGAQPSGRSEPPAAEDKGDIAEIKKQLAELQARLSKL